MGNRRRIFRARIVSWIGVPAVLLMIPGALAQSNSMPSQEITVTGQGIVSQRASSHPLYCDYVVVVPVQAVSEDIRNPSHSVLMDWEYASAFDRLKSGAAVKTVACDKAGKFSISGLPDEDLKVYGHFSWLRGKWVAGGWAWQDVAHGGIRRDVTLTAYPLG